MNIMCHSAYLGLFFFSCLGGREFDELILPGARHFITTHRGVEFDRKL